MSPCARSVLAGLADELGIVRIRFEIIAGGIDTENDVTAITSITAVGAAFRSEFLPDKVNASVTTIKFLAVNPVIKHDS